jgi:pimeloyl-ACP methyl ester carboxylesterase
LSVFNQSNFSTSSGHRLNYAVGPNHGPPLVLFHGVLRGWRDFAPLLAELSLRHHLFLLDFRGHGDSTHDAAGNYRVADYVEDGLSLLHEIVPKPAMLYGHSLGAMVAAAVASRAPEAVAGVILEDPPFESMGVRIHDSPLGSYFRQVQRVVAEFGSRPVAEIARALAEIPMEGQPGVKLGDIRDGVSLRFSATYLRQVDPRVLKPIVEAQWLTGYDLQNIRTGIASPVLLLQGDVAAGGMLTDQDAELWSQEVRDCIRIKFPGTGHLIHWTQREATLRHVIGFMESVR